jgi:SAM-dependent methyltransferase
MANLQPRLDGRRLPGIHDLPAADRPAILSGERLMYASVLVWWAMFLPMTGIGAGTSVETPSYLLGHSEDELARLQRQGTFLRSLSADALRRAGISEGMHVLDVGCGVGDVSLLAADLVGPSGSVLGLDRSLDAVQVARRRAETTGRQWIKFAEVDVNSFAPEAKFDAVIGRFVLMYQPDPSVTLRRLGGHLRHGGIVAFQEFCLPMARCVPVIRLYQQTIEWIIATYERAGFEPDMGAKLLQTFTAAGLPQPELIAGGTVGGGPNCPAYANVAGLMRSLLSTAEQFGVVSPDEVQIDTLAGRIRDEAVALNATVFSPTVVGAWIQLPG